MSIYQAKNRMNPTFRVDVYVNEAEYGLIQSLASEAHQSISGYIRSRILRGKK